MSSFSDSLRAYVVCQDERSQLIAFTELLRIIKTCCQAARLSRYLFRLQSWISALNHAWDAAKRGFVAALRRILLS